MSQARKPAPKPRMRSSWDVINRMLHDPSLNSDDIHVGYWDGIANLVLEKPLSAFSNWGDIAMAELHSLAIPQHRIRHFKHFPSGTILWDKELRLDLIFGSTAPFTKIDFETLPSPRYATVPAAPLHTPLQRFLAANSLTEMEDIRRVLTGPGFGCRVRCHCNLYSVMYESQSAFKSQSSLAQRDLASDALDHCRGVIYEQGTNKLVCMAFDKFWESFDNRSAKGVLDWSSAVVTEKCDGMLAKLYFHNNAWRIASNGMINADKATLREAGANASVGSLFRDAANTSLPGGYKGLLEKLDVNNTYSFELCHPVSNALQDQPVCGSH